MSKIEVNAVEPQCGTTLTLGASGDTVTLGSGASQSGFGRTGTVDWQTTKKTASFTAVNGEGYFVDTSSSSITVTLPASPSAGNIIYVKDYNGSFGTNSCTIARNGSNIRGETNNIELDRPNAGVVCIYVDATEGWQLFYDGSDSDGSATYICATGGTVTTCGNCKIHTFTGPGTFTVNCISDVPGNNIVSYMVVAGGGGAAGIGSNNSSMGAGGAGGFRELKSPSTSYTASPLDGYCTPGNRVTVTATSFPITVGGGGSGGSPGLGNIGAKGSNSVFSTITSTGGGYGSGYTGGNWGPGSTGGSGGSGGYPNTAGMAGNTPPVSPPQGNPGGDGTTNPGGCASAGGGGAGAAGANATKPQIGGAGGIGAGTQIAPASGTPGPSAPLKYFAGGGGGAPFQIPGSISGGAGGGGGNSNGPSGGAGTNGTANTGGGAGGTNSAPGSNFGGASGGSGIVVIRYRYQ